LRVKRANLQFTEFTKNFAANKANLAAVVLFQPKILQASLFQEAI
jgi:hypothetical protein